MQMLNHTNYLGAWSRKRPAPVMQLFRALSCSCAQLCQSGCQAAHSKASVLEGHLSQRAEHKDFREGFRGQVPPQLRPSEWVKQSWRDRGEEWAVGGGKWEGHRRQIPKGLHARFGLHKSGSRGGYVFLVHSCDLHTTLFTKNFGLDSRAPGAWGPVCHLRPEHSDRGQPGFDCASLKEENHPRAFIGVSQSLMRG